MYDIYFNLFIKLYYELFVIQFEALDVSTDNSLTKSSWMKKLNIMSPGKLQAPPSSPMYLFSSERFNHQENENNLSAKEIKCALSPQRPQSLPSINKSLDVIDLEKVINDFEMEYLSPTKQNNQQLSNNKFVKKMVAIFEKKTMITSKYSKVIQNFYLYFYYLFIIIIYFYYNY